MTHFSNNQFFSKLLLEVANLCNLRFVANEFVCSVMTDLLTQFCSNLIYICTFYDDACPKELIFFKITIGSYQFMQHAIFLQINYCTLFCLIY